MGLQRPGGVLPGKAESRASSTHEPQVKGESQQRCSDIKERFHTPRESPSSMPQPASPPPGPGAGGCLPHTHSSVWPQKGQAWLASSLQGWREDEMTQWREGVWDTGRPWAHKQWPLLSLGGRKEMTATGPHPGTLTASPTRKAASREKVLTHASFCPRHPDPGAQALPSTAARGGCWVRAPQVMPHFVSPPGFSQPPTLDLPVG